MAEDFQESLKNELKEYSIEMRERSHQLSAIIQQHAADLAAMKQVAEHLTDLSSAVYGDLKSGVDVGLRGAVQRLYQEIRDIEMRRQGDRKREDEQWAAVIAQNDRQTKEIETLKNYAERRGGAFGLVREIGSTITVLAAAGGLILGVIKLALMK